MVKVIKIAPLIILAILSLISISGRMSFGNGLGDLFYYGLIYMGLIFYSVYFFWLQKHTGQLSLLFPILSIIFCVFMLLSMTIWRGSEYPWDGDILTPVHEAIDLIENKQY